jgi:hypothetical protein
MKYLTPLFTVMLLSQTNLSLAETFSFKSQAFQTPVLELYTSEGCSSCPPADQWLSQMIRLPSDQLNALALALHVDYWDYIGWKDPYASAQYTQRQRSIAQANRQSSIYTPEFVLNGKEIRGTRGIIKNIKQANQTPADVALNLKVDKQDDHVNLQLLAKSHAPRQLQVEFVLFENNLSSQVKAGENAGETLKHQQVVRYLSPALPLKSKLQHRIDLHAHWSTQNLGIAAIVHNASGEYLQTVYGLI